MLLHNVWVKGTAAEAQRCFESHEYKDSLVSMAILQKGILIIKCSCAKYNSLIHLSSKAYHMLTNAYHTGSYINNMLSLDFLFLFFFFLGQWQRKMKNILFCKKLVKTYLLEMYSLYSEHHMFWKTFIPFLKQLNTNVFCLFVCF